LQSWGLHGGWLWLFCLYLVMVNSLLEELMWRGFVLQRLLPVMSKPAAILLSSFFFSLYHLIIASVLFNLLWGVCITLLVFAAGVLWAWMKSIFPSIYPTWFSHLLADAGIAISLIWWIYT
jgi:membrane protease YdiL (CAAX protease family)